MLRDDPDAVHVFIHASRQKRLESRNQAARILNEQKALEMMIKTDKKRASYFNFYTSLKWGQIENYNLCVDSGAIGVDNAVDLIAQFVQMHRKFW